MTRALEMTIATYILYRLFTDDRLPDPSEPTRKQLMVLLVRSVIDLGLQVLCALCAIAVIVQAACG